MGKYLTDDASRLRARLLSHTFALSYSPSLLQQLPQIVNQR